jgi:hypothetical protein
VRTLEKFNLGSYGGLRPPTELLFGYYLRSYLKSIGRIYSTCNLQESNRRWQLHTKLSPFLAGPGLFAGRALPRRLRQCRLRHSLITFAQE